MSYSKSSAIILVIITATFLRFWELANYRPGFSGHCAVQFRIREVMLNQPLFSGDFLHPMDETGRKLFFSEETAPAALLESIFLQMYRFDLGSIRAVPASIGVITVGLAIILGAQLGGIWLGVWCGALLATAPWHVTISRYDNTEHVLVPIYLILALITTFRVLKSGTWPDWLVLGLILGSSIYLYAACQIVPVIVILVLAYGFIRRGFDKFSVTKVLATLTLAMVIAAPQYYDYLSRGHYLPLRKNDYSNELYHFTSFSDLPRQSLAAAKQLFIEVNDPWLEKPGGALQDYVSVLAIVTIAATLFSPINSDSFFFLRCTLLAELLGLIPGILSPIPYFRRIIITTTLLQLSAAVPLFAIGKSILKKHLIIIFTPFLFAAAYSCYVVYFAESLSYDSYVQTNFRALAEFAAEQSVKSEKPIVLLAPKNEHNSLTQMIKIQSGNYASIYPAIEVLEESQLTSVTNPQNFQIFKILDFNVRDVDDMRKRYGDTILADDVFFSRSTTPAFIRIH